MQQIQGLNSPALVDSMKWPRAFSKNKKNIYSDENFQVF